ncbi:hypothetical protein WJX72_009230 [[Myrmecia] bisecta]|uniref:Uncharacterized protein n=1 Tax=[Myrmecia] bisecta TaxID=41462 RepID=A0AAW1R8Q1_9CHLO
MHKEQTVKQHAEALRLHTWYPVTVNGVRINTISDQQLANIQLTPNSEGKCELGPDRRAAEMVIQFAYHPPTFLAQLDREPERLSALQQLAMKYQIKGLATALSFAQGKGGSKRVNSSASSVPEETIKATHAMEPDSRPSKGLRQRHTKSGSEFKVLDHC